MSNKRRYGDPSYVSLRWIDDIHTNFELPLLLDGRKKLARMGGVYPPLTFEGEDRFDQWVSIGRLYKEVVIEPFDESVKHPRGYLGDRTVYYTPIGEEWRIPAMRLIWDRRSNFGGWNQTLERLEGMLFGYEDWQNDWWIERCKELSAFHPPAKAFSRPG